MRKMHQRRGAGGGVRACGARREQRERRGARVAARDSIADGTALRCAGEIIVPLWLRSD